MSDAIDTVLDLRTGDAFTLRGRTFVRSGGCVSHYEGRMTLGVWNQLGREVTITVRATDRITVGVKPPHSGCYCPDDCNCRVSWRPTYCGCTGRHA
jgi:hypothetical protein